MTGPTSPTSRSRRWRIVALLAALTMTLGACGDGNGDDDTSAGNGGGNGGTEVDERVPEDIRESGVARVGIANEVPYGYEDEEGEVTGAAVEVAREVLAELGIDEIDATVVDFGALIAGLEADQYDMITAGMFINEERANQILFSDPDYCVSEAFAVEEGNPLDLSDYQSVVDSGATIAILSGAVEEGYAEAAGVPDDQIELFTDVNAQYDALDAGRVDAVTGTSLTVQTQVDAREGVEATEPFFPLDEEGEEIVGCGGHGFADEDFRDAFNEALAELQEDGTVEEIYTEFGFAEEDVQRAADLTLEDLVG